MFYLRREMEERDAGTGAATRRSRPPPRPPVAPCSISGFTVMVAMAGMFLAGNAVFESFARRHDHRRRGRDRRLADRAARDALVPRPEGLDGEGPRAVRRPSCAIATKGESRVWGAIIDRVLQRPLRVGRRCPRRLLVALAIPALGMHTINPGVAGLPRSLPIMQTYDRVQAAFPGGAGAGRRRRRRPRRHGARGAAPASRTLQARGGADRGPRPADHGRRTTRPRRSRSSRSRSRATAPTASRRPPWRACATTSSRRRSARAAARRSNVTGMTAGSKDFNDTMKSHLPLVFGVRPRADVPAAARHVPLARHPDQGDRAEPAVGRRVLRRPDARLPGRARRGAARTSTRSAGSRRGCRCSCS